MENNKKTNIIQILLKRDFKHTLLRILVVLIISGFFIEILPEKYQLKSAASLYVYVFLEPILFALHHRNKKAPITESLKSYIKCILIFIIAIIGVKVVCPDNPGQSEYEEDSSEELIEEVIKSTHIRRDGTCPVFIILFAWKAIPSTIIVETGHAPSSSPRDKVSG